MVRARVVFNLVLDELKSRQANAIKRLMIGTAGVRDRNRLRVPLILVGNIAEGGEPLLKDRPHCIVALEINPANPSGPVVELEIAGELLVFRKRRQLGRSRVGVAASARPTTTELRTAFKTAKVGLDVSA